MKAFVTGASGFLGGRLVELLCENKQFDEIRILLRREIDISHLTQNPQVKVVIGSLNDEAAIKKGVDGVHYIFHCAAFSSDWGRWKDYYESNVLGTQILLSAAFEQKNTLQRFVHVSTVDVYGYPDNPLTCDESKPPKITSLPYNKSKVMGEQIVQESSKKGLPVTIFRPANIYGPKGKDFVKEIYNLLKEGSMLLISSGKCISGLVYVDNVAFGMIEAALSPNSLGQIYNIVDDSGKIEWKDYVWKLADETGTRRPWLILPFWLAYLLGLLFEFIYSLFGLYSSRPLLTRHAVSIIGKDGWFPNTKSKKDFGYKEVVSFKEGMDRTIKWCKDQDKKTN